MLARLKAVWSNLWAKINLDAKELWSKDKVFFIIFGAIILIVKFRDIFISLLVSGGKKTMDNAQKKDDSLATQEKTENGQADALVKQAEALSNKETLVQPDWYKDKK
jgi:hypothetical protein